MPFSCERRRVDFLGNPHSVHVNSEYFQELCRTMNDLGFVNICHSIRKLSICLPKFGHQTLNCPSIRYIVHAKIFPALPLCQKNWFCGKVRLDDFYPLLRSIVSTWIHIDVKRISQVCCLHHLKNMEKKNVKHNFGMKNKIGRFFLGHPVYAYSISVLHCPVILYLKFKEEATNVIHSFRGVL